MITRRSVIFAFLILQILMLNQTWAGDTITGKVVSISDGDTITVLDSSKTQHKIRLYGVDCPESHQDFGQKAKQFTSNMVFGQTVSVKSMDTDRYGRTVGLVDIGSKSLNEELVKNGMAWIYDQYCKVSFCSQWNQYQEDARSRNIGIWSMPNPIPPWEFRRGKSENITSREATNIESSSYHGNIKSRIFHKPGCRYYDCVNCIAIFKTKEAATQAGYRSCKICKP